MFFRKHLLPDASNIWLLLFIWVKQNAREENVYYESKDYLQRSLWEENISKRWSDNLLFFLFYFFFLLFVQFLQVFLFNIWLWSKISWVEKLRNNGLNINNKKFCCVTQTGKEMQKSQFYIIIELPQIGIKTTENTTCIAWGRMV